MRTTPLLCLPVALLLVLPVASASAADGAVCSELPTGACVDVRVTATWMDCAPTGTGTWTCEVLWTLQLNVHGPTCGYAFMEPTMYVITCDPTGLGATAWTTGAATYEVPAGGATITETGIVCVDHFTPFARCETFDVSFFLVPS